MGDVAIHKNTEETVRVYSINKTIGQGNRMFDWLCSKIGVIEYYFWNTSGLTVINVIFLLFTIVYISLIYIFKHLMSYDMDKLFIFGQVFSSSLEIAYIVLLCSFLLFTLRKIKNSPRDMSTEYVWLKSILYFISKVYYLLFLIFLMGIFKGNIYLLALQENKNKPMLSNIISLLIMVSLITIGICVLLPILIIMLYQNKVNTESRKRMFALSKMLISISLVAIIMYYISKLIEEAVASSTLTLLKIPFGIETDFNSSGSCQTEGATERDKNTPIDTLLRNNKFKNATEIIKAIIVFLIFIIMIPLKCIWTWGLPELDKGVGGAIDSMTVTLTNNLFQENGTYDEYYNVVNKGGNKRNNRKG